MTFKEKNIVGIQEYKKSLAYEIGRRYEAGAIPLDLSNHQSLHQRAMVMADFFMLLLAFDIRPKWEYQYDMGDVSDATMAISFLIKYVRVNETL